MRWSYRSFIISLSLFFSISTFATYTLPLPLVEALPNGMKVAWFLDDRLPLVDLGFLVQSGTRNDSKGKSGSAELVVRLLERGYNGFTAQEIGEKIESLGATAFTSAEEDYITLGYHGLSQDAGELLKYLSWAVRKPSLSEIEFNKEKAKIIESWKHLPDSAESLAGFAFGRSILGGSVYGRGSLQSIQEIKRLSVKDIRDFHENHFSPKNSLLVVVGRVDRDEFRKKILEAFGGWSGGIPSKPSVVYRDHRLSVKAGEILVVDRPGIPQAQVRLGFKVPGVRSENRYSLAVVNAFLGEYFNSRLNLTVRDKLGLAYGIHSSITYYKDLAFFSVSSATSAQTTGQLLSETIRQLRLVKAGDILKEEVDVSKEYLLGGYPLGVSTMGAVANRWMGGYVFGFGVNYLNEFMPKIAEVSRESVIQAVDEAFQLDQLFIVIAGDAKIIEKSLREKGFKRVRKIPASSLL